MFFIPAAAGIGNLLEDEEYETIGFDPDNMPDGTDFGIRVDGDSMVLNGGGYQHVETMPDEEERENFLSGDGRVRPRITLYSPNRDRSDCDVRISFSSWNRIEQVKQEEYHEPWIAKPQD